MNLGTFKGGFETSKPGPLKVKEPYYNHTNTPFSVRAFSFYLYIFCDIFSLNRPQLSLKNTRQKFNTFHRLFCTKLPLSATILLRLLHVDLLTGFSLSAELGVAAGTVGAVELALLVAFLSVDGTIGVDTTTPFLPAFVAGGCADEDAAPAEVEGCVVAEFAVALATSSVGKVVPLPSVVVYGAVMLAFILMAITGGTASTAG